MPEERYSEARAGFGPGVTRERSRPKREGGDAAKSVSSAGRGDTLGRRNPKRGTAFGKPNPARRWVRTPGEPKALKVMKASARR